MIDIQVMITVVMSTAHSIDGCSDLIVGSVAIKHSIEERIHSEMRTAVLEATCLKKFESIASSM